MAADEREIAIDEAAFVVAGQFHTDLNVEEWLARVDDLAAGCGPTLTQLRERMFDDLGFAGNTCGYYDQQNSFLDSVIERRLGIPITLSVIAMAIGRRIGRPLFGVGMPGHFLTFDPDSAVYIDAFDGGAVLDVEGCRRLFEQLHGPDAPWHPSLLSPIGPRAIVRRMLNNLAQIAIAESDHSSRIIASRLRSLLPDASLGERAELARAYEASGALATSM